MLASNLCVYFSADSHILLSILMPDSRRSFDKMCTLMRFWNEAETSFLCVNTIILLYACRCIFCNAAFIFIILQSGETPLIVASRHTKLQLMKCLLLSGADPNCSDKVTMWNGRIYLCKIMLSDTGFHLWEREGRGETSCFHTFRIVHPYNIMHSVEWFLHYIYVFSHVKYRGVARGKSFVWHSVVLMGCKKFWPH